MSDTCMNARMTVSLAYDGETVSPQDLQTAKLHCAECAECARFVSGLARLRATPAPSLSDAAVERALEAVRAQRSRDAIREAAAARTAPPTAADTDVPLRARSRWAPWTGWAAAAAGVFLVVGVITWQGVSYLMAPRGESAVLMVADDMASGTQESAVPTPEDSWSTEYSLSAEDATKALRGAAAPPYVVFGGYVYQVDPDETRLPVQADPIGTVMTDLESGMPALRDVYEGEETGQILIAADERLGRLASLVVREYDNRRYGMQSPDVTVFGTWPSLPGALPQPSSTEGASGYDKVGEDADGVTVYVQPGKDPSTGFLVAPDTRADDPAAANPNWTYWSPLR